MNTKGKGKAKGKFFSLTVKLLHTGEKFPIKKVSHDMKIRELKNLVEFASGIPCHMQILTYLDEGDLQDHTDVRYNDVVPGATLDLKVWHMWQTLVEAAATKDLDWLMRLGVTKDTSYKTPNSEYMMPRLKQKWIADRAAVALYIAAHRGYVDLCQKLIEAGADVNAKTNLGRTALHVAAAQGRGSMIDLLLEKGADINQVDDEGNSALAIADKFGHKDCERHLFLFRWQERAKQAKSNIEREMMAHQYHDSAFPVWLKGSKSQIYYVNILPPGEFEGTMFHSPLRRPRSGTTPVSVDHQSEEEGGSDDEDFDEFRRRNFELDDEEAYHAYRQKLQDKRLKMPPIAEASPPGTTHRGQHKKVGFRKGPDSKDKTKTFEEWLRKKEIEDKKKLEQKKLEKERKKQEKEEKLRQIEQRIAARNKAKGKKDTGNDSDSGEFETENVQSSWINQTASHMLLFT